MSYVSTFIYCLNTTKEQSEAGESINALGVLTALTPDFIPGSFSFSVIFSVMDIDDRDSHEIKLVFSNCAGNELVNTGVINIPKIEDKNAIDLPKEVSGLIMSLDLRNVTFLKEGYYCTTVWFDGDKLGEYKIYVKGKIRNE
ncbi:MAG TPA: hypothetical protein VFD89_01315 [Clostridia bacterium]|nr:hypothetical protein [Clostridia bacterium]